MENFKIKRLDVFNFVFTNVCNSKCLLCNYWRVNLKCFLNYSVVVESIKYINKYRTRKIYITGGEPLLHPNFYEMVKVLREETKSKMTLCTNGFLIPKFIDKISHLFDAYIISFDGDTRETYCSIRGVDWFNTILKVPKLIKNKNPDARIAFTCVIQRRNYKILEKILRKADEIGCDFMGFTLPTLVPHAFGWKTIPSQIRRNTLLTKKEIEELKRIIEKVIALEKKLNIELIQPWSALTEYPLQLEYELGIRSPLPVECPIPFQEIVIDENERIRPCYILPPIDIFKSGRDPVNSPRLLKFRVRFLEHIPFACYHCYIRLLHRHIEKKL